MGVWSYDFVEVHPPGGPQTPADDVDRRVYSLSSAGKSYDPVPRRPRGAAHGLRRTRPSCATMRAGAFGRTTTTTIARTSQDSTVSRRVERTNSHKFHLLDD